MVSCAWVWSWQPEMTGGLHWKGLSGCATARAPWVAVSDLVHPCVPSCSVLLVGKQPFPEPLGIWGRISGNSIPPSALSHQLPTAASVFQIFPFCLVSRFLYRFSLNQTGRQRFDWGKFIEDNVIKYRDPEAGIVNSMCKALGSISSALKKKCIPPDPKKKQNKNNQVNNIRQKEKNTKNTLIMIWERGSRW